MFFFVKLFIIPETERQGRGQFLELIKHNLAQIWYENPFKSHPNLAQNSFNKSHLNITIDNMYVLGIE